MNAAPNKACGNRPNPLAVNQRFGAVSKYDPVSKLKPPLIIAMYVYLSVIRLDFGLYGITVIAKFFTVAAWPRVYPSVASNVS